MDIHESREGAVTVVRPVGALAQGDADQFKSFLSSVMERSLGRFVVDASAIPYVDSRGLEVFAEASESLSESGLSLRLCAANETVRESLDLTEIASMVEHFADVQTGVRSFL